MNTGHDTMVRSGVRSGRLKNVKGSDAVVNDDANTLKTTLSTKEYQPAIVRHLSSNTEHAKPHCNGLFKCFIAY